MRRLLPLLVPLALAGCSGFDIGVRQDKEDRASLAAVLARERPGVPFAASRLLPAKGFARLWVFRGGIATQPLEDRIGIPFPKSGVPTPKGRRYLVFDDGKQVISSFSLTVPRGVSGACLLAERRPLGPRTLLVLVRGPAPAPARLSTVAGAAACR